MSDTATNNIICRRIVFFSGEDRKGQALFGQISGLQAEILPGEAIHEGYKAAFDTLSAFFRDLIVQARSQRTLVQTVFLGPDCDVYEGLWGFLASVHLEAPNLIPQLILLPKAPDAEEILRILKAEAKKPAPVQARYQDGRRFVRVFERKAVPSDAAAVPDGLWKDGGVYLITGGAGGLGLLIAKHIADTVRGVSLLLTGRKARYTEDLCREAGIDESRAKVRYFASDICRAEDVQKLADEISRDYGKLTGVIHCAGMTRDALLPRKKPEDAEKVLGPKITGLLNLDRAFAQIPVGFWLLMSSSAGVMGNVGQTDYAAANGFMDAYARRRNRLGGNGAMISVNWPLWKDGGMQIDSRVISKIYETTGLKPLETASAFAMLNQAAAERLPQFVPTQGDQRRIGQWLDGDQSAPNEETEKKTDEGSQRKPEENAAPAGPEDSGKMLEAYVKGILSAQIHLPAEKMDARVPLEEFGLTSIMTMDLTERLEKDFGPLPSTLFFEVETLGDLVNYLRKNKPEQAAALSAKAAQKEKEPARKLFSAARRNEPEEAAPSAEEKEEKRGWDIAVIGLAGRYPGAENTEAFWDCIRDGKDCITPIPESRWNHDPYYDPDHTRTDRTYGKWGGFLKDAECFDPLFFSISPAEAQSEDPQERLFLQCVYHAMEDAGYTRWDLSPEEKWDLKNRVGVFVGVMYEEYQLYGAQAQARGKMYTLNGSEASIANRVSYTFGFHGPSMAVDSMCSSSLSALHLACKSILSGECGVAVAGGVNLSLHPNKFLMLGQSRFLSSRGRCEAFGEGGDGYVPGEGVGAVILKPYSRAVADGDHIYGVIRSSAINHSGKTNGYTVPNPKAQTGVILEAWKTAGINPRALSYIEAHGTGTALGDPIEMNGLTRAFETVTKEKQFAYIGSVKANIGHCESAAGVAGLTKVLLQMKHGQIAPSIHSIPQNPNIHFEETPCQVPHTLIPWARPKLQEGDSLREYPRIAAVSAFGAGGTNAHVVVEEAPRQAVNASAEPLPLFALSARTEPQLRQKAADLTQWLDENRTAIESGEIRLCDVAYTLLAGREAMEVRAAWTADSFDSLQRVLNGIASGDAAGCCFGKVSKHSAYQGAKDAQVEESAKAAAWMREGKAWTLAEQWTKGLIVDFAKVFAGKGYRRISLPLYPFKRDRFWKPDQDQAANTIPSASSFVSGALHPLLHRNVSGFGGVAYESVFHASDTLLKDHQVAGVRTLPGVAALEMARAAYLDASQAEASSIALKDVLWARPVTLPENGSRKVLVTLTPRKDGTAEFSVCTQDAGNRETCCTGTVGPASLETDARIPVSDLWASAQKPISGENVYACFGALGLNYGLSMRSIREIRRTKQGLLVQLHLPEGSGQESGFGLIPAIADGALQGTLALSEESPLYAGHAEGEASVPFMLGGLKIASNFSADMWAVITPDSEEPERVNIALCNDDGKVCARFDRMAFRRIREAADSQPCLFFGPVWERPEDAGLAVRDIPAGKRILFLAGTDEALNKRLEASGAWSACRRLYPAGSAPSLKDYESYFETVYAAVREAVGSKEAAFIQVLTGGPEHHLMESLTGLFKTAALETPLFRGQCVVPETTERLGPDDILAAARRDSPVIRLGDGMKAMVWREINTGVKEKDAGLWKDGGVYCITGAFGGLGRIFAEAIVSQAQGVSLALLARSPLDDSRAKWMADLESRGAVCRFYQADVTDEGSVRETMEAIGRDFGRLTGILHCAGVVRDHLILMKDTDEWRKVTKPKVAGTWYLDEHSQKLKPELFILFSSFTAVTGNPGQADYALGNSFMDQFAAYRNRLASEGKRTGRTLSVNWPFWKDGGIALDEAFLQAMREKSGMTPMERETGIEAMRRIYGLGLENTAPVTGIPARLRALFRNDAEKNPGIEQGKASSRPQDKEALLMKVFSELLMLGEDDLQPDTLFEDLGIDSILSMKITDRLEQHFGPLPKTLLFECQTIKALASRLPDGAEQTASGSESKEQRAAPSAPPALTKNEEWDDEIVIIGAAGQYAQAENLRQLWKNLEEGRDCITEIPADRWDWRDYEDSCYARWGGFLPHMDQFDPLFFNIVPNFANIMDPQERLFLETAYHAVEDAGYTRKTLGYEPGGEIRRNVGVFVGIMNEQYQLYATEEHHKGNMVAVSAQTSSVANRVSYFFDFHGPSFALDTMCSSALVALHLACQAIRNGDCEMAIAGGVNVLVHPDKYLAICQSKMASKTGRCKSFGKGGDGYVPGEGSGAVLIKRKSKAIADGDHIYAVIRGTAVNHGGRVSGYTVPNPIGQTAVIRDALRQAGISAREISNIEAHGTGTALGDPIELTAITNAFRADTQDTDFCRIGSIKSNIGHCESAAGVAAIHKVLLEMQHKKLAPSLHAEVENPNLSFAGTPFRLQKTLETWEKPVLTENGTTRTLPLFAGVSAFGAGGVNAHVILEAWEEDAPAPEPEKPEWILLSARTEASLKGNVQNLIDFLAEEPETRLCDIARTLIEGREVFEMNAAFRVSTVAELKAQMQSWLSNGGNALTDSDAVNRMLREYTPHGRRISLPGYAFDNTRCWLAQAEETDARDQTGKIRLTGQESYIRDHFVGEHHVLPGSAVLELVRRAAAEIAGQPVGELRNIMWMHPLTVEGAAELRLKMKDGGAFELRSVEGAVATGQVVFGTRDAPVTDEDVLTEMERAGGRELTEEACYEAYAAAGLPSGDSFRVIRSIRSSRTEGFAVLDGADQETGCVISPALLNGVFQSVMGILSFDEQRDQMLPFALEQIELYRAFPEKILVYIRREAGTDKMAKFTLLVTDRARNPVCLLHHFTLRATDAPVKENYFTEELRPAQKAQAEGFPQNGDLLLLGAENALSAAVLDAAKARSIPLLGMSRKKPKADASQEEYDAFLQSLKAEGRIPERILFLTDAIAHEKRMREGLYALIRLCKALIALKPKTPVQVLFACECGSDEIVPEYEGLAGFARSIRMENPMLRCQIIEMQHLGGTVSPQKQADGLLAAFGGPDTVLTVLRDGVRMEKTVRKITDLQ